MQVAMDTTCDFRLHLAWTNNLRLKYAGARQLANSADESKNMLFQASIEEELVGSRLRTAAKVPPDSLPNVDQLWHERWERCKY